MPEKSNDASRLVLGTVALGVPYGFSSDGQPSASEAYEIFKFAHISGITHFDTAPSYGEAEHLLGQYNHNNTTHKMNVWTKLSNLKLDPNLGKEAISSLENSLRVLSCNSVEYLQWHNWNASMINDPHFLEVWKLLRDNNGIKALGASTYGIQDALAAVQSGLFDIVQIEWNLLNQSVLNTIGQLAIQNGVKIALRSIFLQGILTPKGKNLPENLLKLTAPRGRAERLAMDFDMPINALALRAALDHPANPYVLIGPDRLSQLQEIIKHSKLEALTKSQLKSITMLNEEKNPMVDPRNWQR
jgi:aryl-alcohol dehydrogenase-like predicted oxidoreductase